MKLKHLTTGIFLLLLVIVPSKAFAWNPPCLAQLSSLGSTAAASAQLPIGGALGTGDIIASGMIAGIVPFLEELADCASYNVYQGELLIANTITENFTNLEDDMIQDNSMVANEITNALVTKEMGGATTTAPSVAVGGAGCQSVDAAAQYQSGTLGRITAEQGVLTSIQTIRRSVTTGTQNTAYINTQNQNSVSPAALFVQGGGSIDPGSGSSSSSSGGLPNQSDSTHYIMNLTDPNPPPRPNTMNQGTPAARVMIAKMKVRTARMSLAQQALAKISSYNTATYPLGSWFTNSLTSMGAPAPTPSSSGLISEHQMMSALVNARFANPNWYSNIAVENTSDLLREIAYEQAILLKLEMDRYNVSLYGLAINSSRYAMLMDHPQP